jgi:O-antigen/teichoic acid export membrane protein
MLNAPVILYLGSRILSAAGNLLAIVIFTRLAEPADYGRYLLIVAWAWIVHGFVTQWLSFAYFGVFQARRVEEYVVSLLHLICAGVVAIAVGLTGIAMLGIWEPSFLFAVFILFSCVSIYQGASQVSRSMLDTRTAALLMILRAIFTVSFGSLVLWIGWGATGLAYAVAIAHLIAAIPGWIGPGPIQLSQGSRAASFHILKYGWPLMLSFGVMAVGQSIDRLLIAHYLGAAVLGSYGVIADLIRQSFSIVGESISYSMVTSAKQHADKGDHEGSARVLRTAFNASVAAAAFGAAFFIAFGDPIVRLLLAPEYYEHMVGLIPIFAIAYAFQTMQNYYFAQVIYFTHASYLEPVVSGIFITISCTLLFFLLPRYGPLGAAIALMLGFLVTCFSFAIVGRRYYYMPIDSVGLAKIVALAGLFILMGWLIGHLVPYAALSYILKAIVFVVLGGFVVYRFNLLHPKLIDTAGKF